MTFLFIYFIIGLFVGSFVYSVHAGLGDDRSLTFWLSSVVLWPVSIYGLWKSLK